jgi:hypothetical protein
MKRILALSFALLPVVALATEPTDANLSGKKERAMQLCPSAVPGAHTEARNVPQGVELVIKGNDESTRAEIRRRAQKQEEISQLAQRGSVEHTGLGTGSGQFGHCPGMLEDTDVKTTETPDGVKILVHARTDATATTLQKTTRERLRELPQ